MTATQTSQRERLLTIGAVCERLKSEFPDISISKIRYLEGEGLVTPQRTRGGYRLFGEDELERIRGAMEKQYGAEGSRHGAIERLIRRR